MSGTASLVARQLAVSRSGIAVLDGVDLTVTPTSRVGVVGPNGTGKSTLLQLLGGRLAPDQGSVTLNPPSISIGLIAQEPERSTGETVAGALARRAGVTEAIAGLGEATTALAAGEPGADDRYADAWERYQASGAADFDGRCAGALHELGLADDLLTRSTASLSGGEAAKVSLAATVVARHDVLLLDEPTNDLDFDGLARLEAFLDATPAGVVVVSHDRAFLDRTITSVLEIDEHSRRGRIFNGGWTAYLAERTTARRHAEDDYEQYRSTRADLAGRAQRQRQWSDAGVRKAKKGATDGDKFVVHRRSQTSEKLASKAKATERAIERLEAVDKPWEGWELHLDLASTGRSGDVVARLDGAVLERAGFRLGPLDVQVGWAERVAVRGRNGAGKSTLLAALLGRLPLTAGEQWLGPGVVVGEVDQTRRRFVGAATVLDGFMAVAGATLGEAPARETRALLAKFGLGAEHVGRRAEMLSPGERTRASLALLMAAGTNCLVLDEPTNHLDLPAIEQLEAALDSWTGTLLLVTHDRRFLDAVRIDRSIDLG